MDYPQKGGGGGGGYGSGGQPPPPTGGSAVPDTSSKVNRAFVDLRLAMENELEARVATALEASRRQLDQYAATASRLSEALSQANTRVNQTEVELRAYRISGHSGSASRPDTAAQTTAVREEAAKLRTENARLLLQHEYNSKRLAESKAALSSSSSSLDARIRELEAELLATQLQVGAEEGRGLPAQ